MIGSMLAGTEETPGEVYLYQGRSYKAYRGMGSLGAMADAVRPIVISSLKYLSRLNLFPRGLKVRCLFKGEASTVIHQMLGGLRAAMGYTGAADISSMQQNASFVRITGAGLKESHVHDVTITREAPNYRPDM